jgi:hypothetical protein
MINFKLWMINFLENANFKKINLLLSFKQPYKKYYTLSNSTWTDPWAYWWKLKQRLNEEWSEVVTFCHGLKLESPDWRMRETDCASNILLLTIYPC